MTYGHKTALQLLAQYNQWMNQKLIDTVRPLDHAALWADRGAFFGSIMGTMNHLMVADILWCRRLANTPFGTSLITISDYPVPDGLNAVVYAHLEDYIRARTTLDLLIVDFIDSLSEAAIAGPFQYTRGNNEPHAKTLGLVLTHLFNHQTHHRGQITTLLSQMGLDIGVTDIHVLAPELI